MTPGLLGGLLNRGPPAQTVAELESALETHIDTDEEVTYRLPGSGSLVHETNGGSEESGADGSLAVVTDHRVLFGTVDDSPTVVDIPHTDIKSATLDSGLFNTTLTIERWGDGSYRFSPADGEAASAVEYIEQTSGCWQFVETLVDELNGHAERIRTAIERGQFERVAAVLEEAGETTDELEERVRSAGLENALGDRVDTARRNLQRTRVHTRLELARSLLDEAASRHLDGDPDPDYTGASERYDRAREHLSTAGSLADEHDIDASGVTDAQTALHERVTVLARQPVALAKQATERALGTDDPAVRVATMDAALGHYHDALSVGWGTGLGHPYDREELRFRVALLADGLVDARREYAARLEATGDELADEGDPERACERYRAARDHLVAAVDTAREFRVPDPDPVARDRSRVERKLDSTG
jgi:hypothetical protein